MAVINREFPRKTASFPHLDVGAVRNIMHTVTIGGLRVETLKNWQREELSYSAGSSAEIVFRIFTSKAPELWFGQVPDIDWLEVSQTTIPLPITISTHLVVNGDDWGEAEEFSGVLDSIHMQPMLGTYTVHASSYARILVNQKISETVAGTANANKTTGEVIEQMTAKYGKGLKTYIHPSLKKLKVGKVFKTQLVKTIMNMPVWDLFQSFAEQDHADLFVKGDTLYYVPKPVEVSPDVTELGKVEPSYVYDFDKNIIDVDVLHSPLFAHDVTVTVRSYQPRTQQTYESTKNMSDLQLDAIAKKLENTTDRDSLDDMNEKSANKMKARKPRDNVKAEVKAARIGSKENYVFNVPNATQEDCERIALQIMEDIARKEFIVNLTVRAQPDFNPRQYIGIRGLPSRVANQAYAIKSLSTSSEVGESGQSSGYRTQFVLVNHAVQTAGVSLGT